MIPFGTYNNPTRRTPYLTYGLILANVLVFIWEMTHTSSELASVFYQYTAAHCQAGGQLGIHLADFLRGMFLHVDGWHLIGNMTFLWIFGTNVEDYFGRRRFVVFYLIGGIAAALIHTLLYTHQCGPLVGASGAVSAVLGAYIVLYPGTRVRAGIPFFRFFFLPVTVPAWMMLGLWFILQVIMGTVALNSAFSSVAFFAHIGGFVFGLLFAFVLIMVKGAPETTLYSD